MKFFKKWLKPTFIKVSHIFFSSRGLPFLMIFTALGVFFVLFRMKGVEQDYKQNNLESKIHEEKILGKELRAKKARLMSVKNLREIAEKNDLKSPNQEQIIVIP
ncbi:MAG: hypothetical protein KBD63_01585 [Bacteriovoracaceae bacterium]|nr:hypothetical protein [Bacteriovoracaceae bacterium]